MVVLSTVYAIVSLPQVLRIRPRLRTFFLAAPAAPPIQQQQPLTRSSSRSAATSSGRILYMGPIRVLVSNDDGIGAPGIVALVSALGATELCDVYVSAPAQERSASSHAITLGQHITGSPVAMQGALP